MHVCLPAGSSIAWRGIFVVVKQENVLPVRTWDSFVDPFLSPDQPQHCCPSLCSSAHPPSGTMGTGNFERPRMWTEENECERFFNLFAFSYSSAMSDDEDDIAAMKAMDHSSPIKTPSHKRTFSAGDFQSDEDENIDSATGNTPGTRTPSLTPSTSQTPTVQVL